MAVTDTEPVWITSLYALIEIRGTDAEQFLQGQLTQDVAALDNAVSLPAAWCNPKGRVISLVRLLRLGDTIGLVVPASLAESVAQRLTMYRLRSDVSIDLTGDDFRCIAVSGQDAFRQLDDAGLLPEADAALSSDGLIAVDFSRADRFVEIYGFKKAFDHAGVPVDLAMPDAQHAAMKIRAGLAEIVPENSEKYTPHMLNLDRLGAICFDKGCYTGQEVVARTQNLGQSKRRLMRYECAAPEIAIGDKVSDGERDVGTVVNVQGNDLLAVTPVALHDRTLTIRGAAATPLD